MTTVAWPYESVFDESMVAPEHMIQKSSSQQFQPELPFDDASNHHEQHKQQEWEEAHAHTLLVEQVHHDEVAASATSPSSSHSRSSSPFMSTNVCDASALNLDGVWVPSEMEFESQSESDSSSASLHHSHSSTPHMSHSPFTPTHAPPNLNYFQHMPTISESTIKPEPTRHQPNKDEEAADLQMSASGIGMIAPAPLPVELDSAYTSSSSSNSSLADTPMSAERLTVRARRRTRYTTAAVASEAARASLTKNSKKISPQRGHSSSSSSSSLPSSPPALESTNSMDMVTSNGSNHSSEQDEDDEDEDEDESVSPNKQSAKRKRANSHAALAAELEDLETPDMQGLDKRERNKVSASMYRKRRKVYLDSLEGKVGELDDTISKQNDTISKLDAENRVLKEQVSFLKKMLASFKSGVAGATGSGTSQPTNIHVGGRKTAASAIGSMMFVLIACLVIFCPSAFNNDVEQSASEGFVVQSSMPVGRRGRNLLSIEEVVEFHTPSLESEDVGSIAFHSENPIAVEESIVEKELQQQMDALKLANNTTEQEIQVHSEL